VGEEQVSALIEVKVAPQRDVGFDAIAERIYRFPQARSVYLLSGTYDLLVLVAGKTMHEVADFVSQKLAPIEGVQGTVTHFMLKRYKEDGEILAGGEETKRQPVIL
jgi:DNA-binding Lrp family transcriptional regulator